MANLSIQSDIRLSHLGFFCCICYSIHLILEKKGCVIAACYVIIYQTSSTAECIKYNQGVG